MRVRYEDYVNIAKACVRFDKMGELKWYIESIIEVDDFSTFRLSKALEKRNRKVHEKFLKIYHKIYEEAKKND